MIHGDWPGGPLDEPDIELEERKGNCFEKHWGAQVVSDILCDVCNQFIPRDQAVAHAVTHRNMIVHGLILVAKSHQDDPAARKLLDDVNQLELFLNKAKGG